MVIYLDAAALVKLVHPEAETPALELWLAERVGAPRVSSALAEVEVPRAIRRSAPDAMARVAPVLATLYRLEIGPAVRSSAAAFTDRNLRSLDAIHLATALRLRGELDAFVTYDKRLLAAAKGVGLTAVSPGG
jgi:predicted nucleic acid-binding protein